MDCSMCEKEERPKAERNKAKVVKTQNSGSQTHRIYRCTHEDCAETFHTIEVPRDRFRQLTAIEDAVQHFADRFHT